MGSVFDTLSISPEANANNLPQGVWDADLSFKITDDMDVHKGDTFTLNLPSVYKAYGENSGSDFSVRDPSGNGLFTCSIFSGTSLTKDSRLTCTIINQNINETASIADVTGAVKLPFIFLQVVQLTNPIWITLKFILLAATP